MRIALTGHTGFKGTWLSALLQRGGHEVFGYSMSPSDEPYPLPGFGCEDFYSSQTFGNVLDYERLCQFMRTSKAKVAVHFAAQALVGRAQDEREETFRVNCEGTLNFLRAVESDPHVEVGIVATTDKVYLPARTRFHKESDTLCGVEPYSQSKVIADIMTQQWAGSSEKKWGIVRAGNVFGLGDLSPNRLIPDIYRSIQTNSSIVVRNRNHTRPWQHVLDCVSGYQAILEYLLVEKGIGRCEIFNLGPSTTSSVTVSRIVELANDVHPLEVSYSEPSAEYLESSELQLDSGKIRNQVGWQPKLSLEAALRWALEPKIEGNNLSQLIKMQLADYAKL